MEIHEQIRELLADKENYKVEKGKFFLKDMFDEWSEKKPNSFGVIDVRGLKFTWKNVEAALRGDDVIKEMAQEGLRKAGYSEKEINSVEVVVPLRKMTDEEIAGEALQDTYKKSLKKERHNAPPKKRTELRSAEIKIIRKMLSEKKSINAISKALGVPRFPVMYIVKKIKKGEKLKYEQ